MKPLQLPRRRVQGDDASGVKVRAFGSRTVRVAEAGEEDAALLVDGHRRPHVRAAPVLQRAGRPRPEVRFALLWDHVEIPDTLSREGIPGANVAARLRRPELARTRTRNDQVLVDAYRIRNREGPASTLADLRRHDVTVNVDLSVVAESRRDLARLQIDCS